MPVSAYPIVRAVVYSALLLCLVVGIAKTDSLYEITYVNIPRFASVSQTAGVTKSEICLKSVLTGTQNFSFSCQGTKAHLALYVLGMLLMLMSVVVGFMGGGCCSQKLVMVIFDLLTFLVFLMCGAIVASEQSVSDCLYVPDGSFDISWHFAFYAIFAAAVIPLFMSCIDCCWRNPATTTTTTTVVTTPLVSQAVYVPHQTQAVPGTYQQMQYPQPAQQVPYAQPVHQYSNTGYIPPANFKKSAEPEPAPEVYQANNIQEGTDNAELAE
eukprot:TRINITY_DN33337_c0_g1_i1.p1 TRINITY_DN33337_c0_g1~~TRINITY_DN33337_c0_g1_i1.p1  ORF type:complete len:269 (+),score=47.57 TRINITY_DN33337_c0_g1_i1:42-848(+)